MIKSVLVISGLLLLAGSLMADEYRMVPSQLTKASADYLNPFERSRLRAPNPTKT